MIVNTKTGEIYDRPPRRTYDTREMTKARKRYQLAHDLNIALGLYGLITTVIIALLV